MRRTANPATCSSLSSACDIDFSRVDVVEYGVAPNAHDGAIFTIELGTLIESGFDIGLKLYPIFDEDYRDVLNDKIIKHFWFREIGLETPELFKRFLNRKMSEIMPFYNQVYESTLKQFDPFENYRLESTGVEESDRGLTTDSHAHEQNSANSENATNATSESKSRAMVSQFPQMQLAGNEDYASNGTDSQSNSVSDTTVRADTNAFVNRNDQYRSDEDRLSKYMNEARGLTGILTSQALLQFRNTFLNVDMMVIEELNELFMGLYTDYMNVL